MKALFDKDFELTALGRRLTKIALWLYCLAIVGMCFLPQAWYPQYKAFTTPSIMKVGRLYFLLTPFNTLVNGSKVNSLFELWLVFSQNLTNIFLLSPLVFAGLCLDKQWRSWRRVVCLSFLMSLTIECTQLLLDAVFDAGRVFEVDDLITNTLGGLLALLVYQWCLKLWTYQSGR